MESSAFSGAPVPTETTEAPETTPQPQTPPDETQAQTPQAPEEGAQAGDQQAENPVLSALEGMRQQIDALAQQSQGPQQETDLLSALEAEPEEGEPAEAEPQATEPQYQDAEAQQQLAALQSLIRDEASQLVNPWVQQQQEKEVRALQERYPDIMDEKVLPKVEETVQQFIDATGDDSLVRNAAFVEKAYKLAKAELAEAGAAPAEQVATQGASLETNAGQTQTGAPSTDEEYINQVFGAGRVQSAFT